MIRNAIKKLQLNFDEIKFHHLLNQITIEINYSYNCLIIKFDLIKQNTVDNHVALSNA